MSDDTLYKKAITQDDYAHPDFRIIGVVPVEPDRDKAYEIIWEALSDPMADAGVVAEKVFAALGIGDTE